VTKQQAPHRVVVIGSGFGGLFATKELKRADVEVTIIDKSSVHLFQPLLYQVATGILSPGEVAPVTRDVLRRQKNARVLLGEVVDIDVAARTVTSTILDRRRVTPYDTLIVAAGSGQSYFGNDQFAEHAPGMKSIDDALELRGRIFGAFEMAELETDPMELDAWLTFVVVGAGATGVEMAGQIAELARRTLKDDFRSFDPRTTRVVLLDAAGAVLAPYGPDLSAKAEAELKRLGVEVQLNAKVVDLDAVGITVQDPDGTTRRIASRVKIWAAGVAASPLGRLIAEQTGAEVDRFGKVRVAPDCTVPGHPEIFVLGDMMALDTLPGVAQVAIQSGKYASRQIQKRLAGRAPEGPFHYRDKGTMAVISRFRAVAQVGPFKFAGVSAWTLWLVVHLLFLTGFKNQVTAVLHWAVSFLGRGRSERVATVQQVLARSALRERDLVERGELDPSVLVRTSTQAGLVERLMPVGPGQTPEPGPAGSARLTGTAAARR
jgi:NADH dehydrogenase